MDGTALKGLILAVVALYVIAILVQATAPGAITTFSNTSAISGYTTNTTLGTVGWSESTTSAYASLPALYVVVVVIIFIAIVIAVINML